MRKFVRKDGDGAISHDSVRMRSDIAIDIISLGGHLRWMTSACMQ
jgi:hypothetical protein